MTCIDVCRMSTSFIERREVAVRTFAQKHERETLHWILDMLSSPPFFFCFLIHMDPRHTSGVPEASTRHLASFLARRHDHVYISAVWGFPPNLALLSYHEYTKHPLILLSV